MDFCIGNDILDIGSRRAEAKLRRARDLNELTHPTHFDVPNVSNVCTIYCKLIVDLFSVLLVLLLNISLARFVLQHPFCFGLWTIRSASRSQVCERYHHISLQVSRWNHRQCRFSIHDGFLHCVAIGEESY